MYNQQQYQSGPLPQQKSTIQKLLDDNSLLISLILDLQSKGKQIECLEYQRILYRNLTYLIQFDPSTSHHPNHLPPPDAFIQSQQQSMINGNMVQQIQSDQIYKAQTNTLNQTSHHSNVNSYPLSTSTNASVEQQYSSNASVSSHSNPVTKPQQRSPYLQQGRLVNSNSIDSSYSQSYIPQQQQHSYSIQQNSYGQYPMYYQQQNPPSQSNSPINNSSTNTQNFISNQQIMHNNYNEQQQIYYPQQNYLMQQQWPNQPRIPMQQQQQQQQQQYTSSYQQQVPPQA